LGAEVDEPMVDLVIDEIAEPIVGVEEQMVALVMDMEGNLATLFGDDDFSNDGPNNDEDDEEVWEVNEELLMAPVVPPSRLVMPPPNTYELVKKVIKLSDVEVADGIAIGEIGPKVSVIEGQIESACTDSSGRCAG
ncbi:hypothetical protein Tco_0768478, partial [Tanacetum coccineum]